MPSVCFYFQVHQPLRLRPYTFFDIGHNHFYEHQEENRAILAKVADKCYLPTNRLLRELLRTYEGRFRVAFCISGVALEQFERYQPDVLASFKALAETGCVEFLNETYYHSLAFLFSVPEFKQQVQLHHRKIRELFGWNAKTFRNTELIYNNDLARTVGEMGYTTILAEGADHVLGWRSPNFVYQPAGCPRLRLLLKNYRLSDDIAFRFSNRAWNEFPLTADKFAGWVHQMAGAGESLHLFMDYETFGEHQWEYSGIFEFLKALPPEIFKHPDFAFETPAETAYRHQPVAQLDIPQFVSWADIERDITAWMGNDMQRDALQAVYALEARVKRKRHPDLLRAWRALQTSDHFYYMCTKWFADGDVHKYFNPYKSPYDAYINYMNILTDFSQHLDEVPPPKRPTQKGARPPRKGSAKGRRAKG
jgi:alpha-amylase